MIKLLSFHSQMYAKNDVGARELVPMLMKLSHYCVRMVSFDSVMTLTGSCNKQEGELACK